MTEPCPKCGPVRTRDVPVGKRTRVECSGCGRLVEWVEKSATPAAAAPAHVSAPAPTRPHPTGVSFLDLAPPHTIPPTPAPAWPYVSKKLDLDYAPNSTPTDRMLASAPAIYLGNTAYYRLTAGVYAWIESCGAGLVALVESGKMPRSELDEYAKVLHEVTEFACKYILASEVQMSRAKGAVGGGGLKLPECVPLEVLKRR